MNAFTLDDFDAIEGKDSFHAAKNNVKSFTDAILAANASTVDKTVLIPKGSVYFMGELWFENIIDVTIQLEGRIHFSDNFLVWGKDSESMICFEHSRGLTVKGSGVMDGQGLKWYVMNYISLAIMKFDLTFIDDILIQVAYGLHWP